MLIVVAIIGWILLVIALFIIWVMAKTNVRHVNSLQFFLLAILLSKEFWEMNHTECKQYLFNKGRNGSNQKSALMDLMQSCLNAAEKAQPENVEIGRRASDQYFENSN